MIKIRRLSAVLAIVIISAVFYVIMNVKNNPRYLFLLDSRNAKSSLLTKAIIDNNVELVEFMVKHDTYIVNNYTSEGTVPLVLATNMRNIACVSILLKYGADPDKADKYTGLCAIHIAVNQGNAGVVRSLVKFKANMNVQAERYPYNTPLHMAIETDGFAIAKMIIEAGANTNVRNANGLTPLHIAVMCNSVECVKLLFRFHADYNAKDNDGKIPIDYARSIQMKKLLQSYRRE